MVPSGFTMKQLRYYVPILGSFALIALFLLLPETPNVFGLSECKTCSSNHPYLPLIGTAYFSALVVISLLFPTFPGRYVARGGLTWSVLLALALVYINLPNWCTLCLIGHACNILIWAIWMITSNKIGRMKSNTHVASNLKERLCLTVFVSFSVVALFGCLNLTFMAYSFKINPGISTASLQLGSRMPMFTAKTIEGRLISHADVTSKGKTIINFVLADCEHCKEQLQVLDTVATQLANDSYRLINISSVLPAELAQYSQAMEWVEDKEGELPKLFKVQGYPTLFVMETDGKIAQIIQGVSEQLQLLTSIKSIP
jgi:peroxiredoxin